jgi:hypothetical protein
MLAYENDKLVIPMEYKKMSLDEIEDEKKKLLKALLSSDRPQRDLKENPNNIQLFI